MASVGFDNDVTWSYLEPTDYVWIAILLAIAVGPFITAFRNETSIALAMVLSLLLVMFVQFALSTFDSELFGFDPIHLFSV
ncbi:MAG: hypothetical protein CMA54_02410, partial [Euryarchaeota archaeon]|nr:hypothetical protein [Euryarchaeota archaeon]